MNNKYQCPECKEIHLDIEWTMATEQDSEGLVMPLEIADDSDYIYTCPTCSEIIDNKDLCLPIG
jgi:ssDNA-binding Zn-finger/Zn-ribbon topoisomerase 1